MYRWLAKPNTVISLLHMLSLNKNVKMRRSANVFKFRLALLQNERSLYNEPESYIWFPLCFLNHNFRPSFDPVKVNL